MSSTKSTTSTPIDTLRRLPLFRSCSDRDLKRIDRVSTRVRVAPGDVLAHEGEMGRDFFIVVEGAITITRRQRTLDRLGPGAAYGELAIIDVGASTATVVAAEPSDVLVFNRAEFSSLLSIVPSAGRELFRRAAVRVRELEADAEELQVGPRLEAMTGAG